MAVDPVLMAAMRAQAAPSPAEQQKVALQQAAVCLDAAKFILSNSIIFPIEAQKHAQNYILRCMQGLDNIKIQEAPSPAEN